jgi:outer membrane protein OmpA-like peptidoglycan-associated protein
MAEVCSQCGSALAEGNAFCTKCGARRNASPESAGVRNFWTRRAVPVSPTPAVSSLRIPKAVIAVTGVIVMLIVTGIAGVTHVVHRVRQKAAEAQAVSDTGKKLAELSSPAGSAAQKANTQTPPDISKSPKDDLAATANSPAEDAQKQSSANPVNAIAGVSSAASGSSTCPSTTPSGSTSSAGSSAPIVAVSATADAALIPPPLPKPAPMVPVASTGNQAHDWALEYERTVGGPEADLVVRTGDINNLGFGWPAGFDPFSGQSTPGHPLPNINQIPPQAPPGTDRVMLGTSVMPVHMVIQHIAGQEDRIVVDSAVKSMWGDGYSRAMDDCFRIRDDATKTPNFVLAEGSIPVAAACTRDRELTMPAPIVLAVGELPSKMNSVVVQIFADDFQPVPTHSHFQVSLKGTRIPSFEYAINSLDQSGPIGKLITLNLLPEYWPLLQSGTVQLLIDDPTTHVPDGYAIDFVRILVNPHPFKYQVSLSASVMDADRHTPISGATVMAGPVSQSTDSLGQCQLSRLAAGLVVVTAMAPGYDESSVPVDLVVGQTGRAVLQLRRHQESIAAIEQSISQTGSATIYGIHFDTGSSHIRGDSIPALNAVLGLINNHPGWHWLIAGHTDNEGRANYNQALSEARAKSVVSWLMAQSVAWDDLDPRGFGSTRPVADNATANGRALNRRVEVALAK